MFQRFPAPPLARRCWRPSADCYHTSDGWLLKLELAGVRPEDVQVQHQGRWLIVAGCRRDIVTTSGARCQSLEISYDLFERRFEFPCDLADARITLEFQHGMLMVLVNRAAPSGCDTELRCGDTEILPRL